MEHACLVAGKSNELLARVVQELAGRSSKVLVARGGHLDIPGSAADAVSTVSWNRRSALSARSVLMHARNLYGTLSTAVICYSPTRESVPFHESSIVSIEDRIDAEVKGYLFLLREIVALFQKQRSGVLMIAVLDQPVEVRSPLEAAALGGFTSMAEALRNYYRTESPDVRLCRSADADPAEYARFILDTAEAPRRSRDRTVWRWYPRRAWFFRIARLFAVR